MDKEYIKLVKLEQTSQSFSSDERQQFYKDFGRISDHLRWERKEEFVHVLNNLLKGEITYGEYIAQFRRISDEVSKSREELHADLQKLSLFEPNPKSEGFSRLIENLLSDIRLVEPDDSIRTSDEISPEELIQGIEEFLPKIQEY